MNLGILSDAGPMKHFSFKKHRIHRALSNHYISLDLKDDSLKKYIPFNNQDTTDCLTKHKFLYILYMVYTIVFITYI